MAENMNQLVEEILRGSYDLHVHAGPDPERERRMDALDVGRAAHEAEMAGFVLKSHLYPTAASAHTLNRVYPGLDVAGSIALNREVGGLNPHAVLTAAKMGARVVWMPTRSADAPSGDYPAIRLADGSGKLRPEVHEVLDVVREHDMVLASGHAPPQEAITLFQDAAARGITRMIATHPSGVANHDEMREMVAAGAFVEFTFLECMPLWRSSTPPEMVAAIRKLGVESCVVTTDFGHWMNPPAAEGMRMAIATLLDAGMAADEVETLVKTNPLKLVGKDD